MKHSRRHMFTGVVLGGLFGLMVSVASPLSAAELNDLVAGKVTQVVPGGQFTEGPAWHPDGYLLFTDIPNNRIVRVTPDGEHNDWFTDSQGINGLMCDRAGNVYAAQGDAQRIVRLQPIDEGRKGKLVNVLTKEFEGKPFNKPNDLALDADGGLYFTDPNYRKEAPDQPVEGVYYFSATGETTRVIDDLPRPNGVLVSADGKSLYVANINQREIIRYEIVGPGQLAAGKVIFKASEADGGGPDGMSLDEHGNIYATYRSLIVIAPDGQFIGRVEIPEGPSNCAFGGTDGKTLYITAQKSLYSLAMHVTGIPLQAAGPGATSDVNTGEDAADEPAKTQEIKAGPLTLQIPETWKTEKPSNRLRLAQFSIPAVKDDKEDAALVLSGPFGGSESDNINRWIAQFDADGREVKMTQGKSEQGKYILVELTGTYNMTVGPPIRRQTKAMPDYRVINVMFSANEGGNYFFKLSGPDATVKAAASALRNSFGGDAAQESEYELK